MNDSDLLKHFPTKRIRAADGLAVTGDVWEEAHDYHRNQLRLHTLFGHGSGIVTGLEVVASEPPDNAIYIQPGIAVDQLGQLIVISQALAFDLGRSEGLYYVFATYGEGRPMPRNGARPEEGAPFYVQSEFVLEAKPQLPTGPYVELARIRRQDRQAAIRNAQSPAQPGLNEIDLRYRQPVGAKSPAVLTLGACYADKSANPTHGRGAQELAKFLRSPLGGQQNVWVDDDILLTANLEPYTLIYLVAKTAFQLSPDEMTGLYQYLRRGGTVFIESCRRESDGAAPASDASFLELLASLGAQLEPLPARHHLLSQPALFGFLPLGYETKSAAEVKIGDGVIFSTADYGCLWQGERRGRPAMRDEIRSALEWGANLLAFAADRRRAWVAPAATP